MKLLLRLLLALGVLLGIGELVVRVVPLDAFTISPLSHDPQSTRFEPHPYIPYIPRRGYATGHPGQGRWARHNSLGYRGEELTRDKPPGTFRIVCLGGSSTYGHGPTGNHTTWPAQLEALLDERYDGLDVQVVNAGASGYFSYESLANMAFRLIDLEPDLFLVYHGINDARTWQWPGIQPDASHARARWPDYEVTATDRLLEHSRLFEVLRYHLTDYKERFRFETYVIEDYHEKLSERMKDGFQEEGPVYFARNLRSMVAMSRVHGIDIAFGVQACFWDDLHSRGDRLAVRRAQQVVREVADDLRVPLCDIAGQMPLDRSLFTNDVHVNDEGARRIASLWAQCLIGKGLVRPVGG